MMTFRNMNLLPIYLFFVIFITCYAGPLEDISAMPDLTLFYQNLLNQPDLLKLLQDATQAQQPGAITDFTIFAPSNDAMARLNRRNEDPNLLWRYHIVPGRYDDQAIYNMAQEKFTQANPRLMANVRPQNNLPTLAKPFQLFYGSGFYGGLGPYIYVNPNNNIASGPGAVPWLSHTTLNQTNVFDNSIPLNPYLANLNNYDPNQQSQTYVVAQGSASSGNPNLFPQGLINYYTNIFNPNVNTQFLQNANPPNRNYNPNLQQQQGQMNYASIGIPRPTINNAFILQSRTITRGVVNVIDNILWPPERRDPTLYKTAYDALEDAQFSRLRLLAQRSEYFRSELTSLNYQTFFLPNDQAFASIGSGLGFLLEQTGQDNVNDINDFIRAHILPIVLFPSAMDASKQISTISLGKWVTFRKTLQNDQSLMIDVVSNRQVARLITVRSEDIKFYGNGVVYTIPTVLSGPTRSAADELARSYQYFMSLIQQSGDTDLVNILQGSTAGLGNTGPNIFNPQNILNITVLIPQRISVQQLGNSEELSRNLRRHIIRFPVFTEQFMALPNTFLPPGVPIPQYQRSASTPNKSSPQRHRRRRRRQLNIPPNVNYQQQQQQQQQQSSPIQQKQQYPPIQQQQQYPPIQQQQQYPPIQQQQQQQYPPIQQQQQYPPIQQQQQYPPIQQQQQYPPIQQQQQQQFPPIQQQQQFPPIQQQQQFPPIQQQQQFPPIQQQQQQQLLLTQEQLNPTLNPSYYQIPLFPTSAIFQDGQFYPTMDPTFSIQAQVSPGPQGSVVTLIGRPENSLPFTANILNSESNIPIKNGVMHVIQGILSGTVIPLDTVLSTMQGASSFTQLLQQTGVIDQLKQSGRTYTLFIPTNTALQSIGVTTDINRIRRFVLRHVCADVLLDPMANILRRSGGYYSRSQTPKVQQPQQQPQGRSRQKRQGWADTWRNGTTSAGGQIIKAPDLGPGYSQPQQQVYGGYPAAPSPFSFYNQLYNPGYVMSGYANPNSEYFPGYNGSFAGAQNFDYATLGVGNQIGPSFYSPQITVVPIVVPITGPQNYFPGGSPGGANYVTGPQSCMSMTGERITVQSIAGNQPGGVNQPIYYQNLVVTCCADPSVNAMVQSFNVYPPSFAVYLIGRSLLSQSQTINTLYSHTVIIVPYQSTLIILMIILIFIKYL